MTNLRALRLASLALLAAFVVTAQAPTDKMRDRGRYSNPDDAPLNNPESVLQVVKVKGVLSKVDLEKRTVTVTPNKQKEPEVELRFPQPRGREQVKVSKKLAKQLGKKKLELEELQVGSKVTLRYYPLLGEVMELLIEKPAS